jgi:hypothetical protein
MTPYQLEILNNALEMRDREITEYQVNIDNYTRAIAKIADDDVAMLPFKEQLQELLRTSLVEQRKCQIIREVIADQLAEQ